MWLAPEFVQVERAWVPPDLVVQRRRTSRVGPLRAEQEAVGDLVQLKPIAGTDAERIQYRRRKCYLALGRDFDYDNQLARPTVTLSRQGCVRQDDDNRNVVT